MNIYLYSISCNLSHDRLQIHLLFSDYPNVLLKSTKDGVVFFL